MKSSETIGSHTLEKLRNVHEVEIGGAIIRIIGSVHTRQNTEAELGDNVDLVCAEMYLGATGGLPHFDPQQWVTDVREEAGKEHQYGSVFTTAEKRKLPICGVDLPISELIFNAETSEAIDRQARGADLLLCAAAVAAANELQPITRRTFLRYAAGGLGVVGTYLAAPGVLRDIRPDITHPSRFLFDEVRHQLTEWQGLKPFVMRLRNLVMAHKLAFLAQQEVDSHSGHIPRLAMFVGGDHAPGLIEALRMDAGQRLLFIRKLIEEARHLDLKRADMVADMVNLIPIARPDPTSENKWRGTVINMNDYSRRLSENS